MTDIDLGILINKANRFLKTSRLTIDDGDYDSGISRAYYAMFFVAKAILLTKEIKPKTHSGVISKFGEHFIKNNIFSKKAWKIIE